MFRTARHPHRRRHVVVAAIIATVSAAACADDPTGPQADARSWSARRTDYMCVRPATETTPADTVSPDEHGRCLVGYETLPWG